MGGRMEEVEERVRSVEDWWARCCCGGEFSLEVDGWMEWTRSANQAFTISLQKPQENLSHTCYTEAEETLQVTREHLHTRTPRIKRGL